MIHHAYKLEAPERIPGPLELPWGVTLAEWTPSLLSPFPRSVKFKRAGLLKNWVYHLPRVFYARDRLYAVYSLAAAADVLCQCMVTPASGRFPFMGRDDLQFGLVFTPRVHRKKGLASAMVHSIIRIRGWGRAYWWLAAVDNFPSQAFAESFGFSKVGMAKPTRSRLGITSYILEPTTAN